MKRGARVRQDQAVPGCSAYDRNNLTEDVLVWDIGLSVEFQVLFGRNK